jgi:hypothetical protein
MAWPPKDIKNFLWNSFTTPILYTLIMFLYSSSILSPCCSLSFWMLSYFSTFDYTPISLIFISWKKSRTSFPGHMVIVIKYGILIDIVTYIVEGIKKFNQKWHIVTCKDIAKIWNWKPFKIPVPFHTPYPKVGCTRTVHLPEPPTLESCIVYRSHGEGCTSCAHGACDQF